MRILAALVVAALAQVATTQVDYRCAQSPVENQGLRGTCTAFAVLGALETFPAMPADLSEQAAFALIKLFDQERAELFKTEPGITDGAILTRYIHALQSYPIPHEHALRYTRTAPKVGRGTTRRKLVDLSQLQGDDALEVSRALGKYKLGKKAKALLHPQVTDPAVLKKHFDDGIVAIPIGYRIHAPKWSAIRGKTRITPEHTVDRFHWGLKRPTWRTYAEIKKELGPRFVDTMRKFQGRFACPEARAKEYGGHAVLLCGYTKEGFIMKNSWGTGWGDQGYAIVDFDFHALYAKSALILDSVDVVQPFMPTKDDVAQKARYRMKVQPLPKGGPHRLEWIVSVHSLEDRDPTIHVVEYALHGRNAKDARKVKTWKIGMTTPKDPQPRQTGFALRIDAAEVAEIRKAFTQVWFEVRIGKFTTGTAPVWVTRRKSPAFATGLSRLTELDLSVKR